MSVSNQFYVRDQPASTYNEIEEDISYIELYYYDNYEAQYDGFIKNISVFDTKLIQ
jgi:hypothetical protein